MTEGILLLELYRMFGSAILGRRLILTSTMPWLPNNLVCRVYHDCQGLASRKHGRRRSGFVMVDSHRVETWEARSRLLYTAT